MKPAPAAPVTNRTSGTNKNNKNNKNKKIVKLTEAKTQMSKGKTVKRSDSEDKSHSDSESEVDTAMSNKMKKKALVKMMAKRPTPAAVVKSKVSQLCNYNIYL